ncbi:hypothetical protein GPECTOR_10g776 [Gonium pectorale]|uniref:UBL3-like ubiquitin domain-containing protein n=1 Tax=Gonium pectorale TaxID=33097 RepID=A0A150GQR9_GONPE|nr:hypothetical protein GPECTOR_10g776 [Gonium pectorale]|eukprot:KXZ52147.1 hypothetical protein GPECTOR_10g776 [Gonium pectorale]
MEEPIAVRFRHTAGDLGPFTFTEETSVQALKDKVFAEWPKEYKRDMGEVKPDTVVTMLVHIRPQPAPTKQQGTQTPQKQEQKGCGCTIC